MYSCPGHPCGTEYIKLPRVVRPSAKRELLFAGHRAVPGQTRGMDEEAIRVVLTGGRGYGGPPPYGLS